MRKIKRINLEEIPKADMFVLSFEADQDYYKKENITVKEAVAEIPLQKEEDFKLDNFNSYATSIITFEMEHTALAQQQRSI